MSGILDRAASRRTARGERLLVFIFLLTLPLANPWVRGDGVGYYAYARAVLIEHNLNFERDYRAANPTFRNPRVSESGEIGQDFYTQTGHLENHFSVGPAILWSPFLLAAHGGVLLARALGSTVAADGYSLPYRVAMAVGTAAYGFLGLWLAFRITRQYCAERWALAAALGVWWSTSLPVYMYFNPSWSHAHSAFACALFLWYWHRTRIERTLAQWIVLGLAAGLMINVYYLNAVLLLVPLVEVLGDFARALRSESSGVNVNIAALATRAALFAAAMIVALLPTFVTRLVIYGSPFASGYLSLGNWNWLSPELWNVLFSSNHGLLSWTPLVLFACAGLFLFWRRAPRAGGPLLLASLAFYYMVAAYPDWHGLSSFGNRFFVSLTPIFVIGLAAALERFARLFARERVALVAASVALAAFALWNLGLVYQWGTHLVPARGPVSWSEMTRNQFSAVPRQFAVDVRAYLVRRKALMHRIEQQDIEQLKKGSADEP
jgi:hypothetical protein